MLIFFRVPALALQSGFSLLPLLHSWFSGLFFWDALGTLRGRSGMRSEEALGTLWVALGMLWGRSGTPWDSLRTLWGRSGMLWDTLGTLCGRSGTLWG